MYNDQNFFKSEINDQKILNFEIKCKKDEWKSAE